MKWDEIGMIMRWGGGGRVGFLVREENGQFSIPTDQSSRSCLLWVGPFPPGIMNCKIKLPALIGKLAFPPVVLHIRLARSLPSPLAPALMIRHTEHADISVLSLVDRKKRKTNRNHVLSWSSILITAPAKKPFRFVLLRNGRLFRDSLIFACKSFLLLSSTFYQWNAIFPWW